MVYLGGAVLAGIMKVTKVECFLSFETQNLKVLVCEMNQMMVMSILIRCCRMHPSSGSVERTIWKKELIV